MAERKRRDEEERPDEELFGDDIDVDAVQDDSLDDADGDDDGDDRSASRRAGSGGTAGTATKARPKAEGARPVRKDGDRINVFARIGRFFREIVAELRKVIWPTRKELLTYTAVVIVFVAVMLTIVGLLDQGFARAVLWVFGSGNGAGGGATNP